MTQAGSKDGGGTSPGTAVATRPSEGTASGAIIAAASASAGGIIGAAWSPFSLMDRLDADALALEMQGIASDVLVYKIKDGGKETVGLSKAGIDECCTMLVQQGHVIREMRIDHEFIGDGESKEAIFKCVAARFAVDPASGREVKLDEVIGVKREPLYEERAALTLDSKVPGKRWRDAGHGGKPLTYGEAIDPNHPANESTERDPQGAAMSYLHWIVEASNFDDATKSFVAAILAGVDVKDFAAGKRFNPFWYEHGAMKAARNARFRLVPAEVKAAVMALAKQTGRELATEVPSQAAREPMASRRPSARATTAKREPSKRDEPSRDESPTYVRRGGASAGSSEPFVWIFQPHAGAPIDAKNPDGSYIVPDNDLQKAIRFAEKGLSGKEVPKADGTRGVLNDDERATVDALKVACENELMARLDETTAGKGGGATPPSDAPRTADGLKVTDDLPF
jgi:hypothetical protein